jgi:heat shock protein HtpX
MIDYATGARPITREQSPRLYNIVENLCISRGIPVPGLQIIESDALNAYASGLREGQYRIAITRGLLEVLTDTEIESVLAHELTHIRNRDVQLMVVAVIFAGIFAFVADYLFAVGIFHLVFRLIVQQHAKMDAATMVQDWRLLLLLPLLL